MLKIKTKYDFWKNVAVSMPSGDGVENIEFKIQFEYDVKKSKNKAQEIMEALPQDQATMGLDFIKSVIKDWDGVADEQEKPIPYSKEVLTDLLDIPWVGKAVLDVWITAINGDPALGN